MYLVPIIHRYVLCRHSYFVQHSMFWKATGACCNDRIQPAKTPEQTDRPAFPSNPSIPAQSRFRLLLLLAHCPGPSDCPTFRASTTPSRPVLSISSSPSLSSYIQYNQQTHPTPTPTPTSTPATKDQRPKTKAIVYFLLIPTFGLSARSNTFKLFYSFLTAPRPASYHVPRRLPLNPSSLCFPTQHPTFSATKRLPIVALIHEQQQQ